MHLNSVMKLTVCITHTQHASPLSPVGPHALAKTTVNLAEESHNTLQILKDSFVTSQQGSSNPWQPPNKQLCTEIAALSSHGSIIVPDPRHRKLPCHVLANDKPQPWQLLPMRAAALKQYPDFFGQSTLFFSSLYGAVQKGAAKQLLRASKVGGVVSCSLLVTRRRYVLDMRAHVPWRAHTHTHTLSFSRTHAHTHTRRHAVTAATPGLGQSHAQPRHHLRL
jgi:hypothetical protein